VTGVLTEREMLYYLVEHEGLPDKTIQYATNRNFAKVAPKTEMRDAATAMIKKSIGSVIVSAEGVPTSIFTERDLLNKVLSNNVDLYERIGSYSSFPLITAKTGIGAKNAAPIMTSHKIKRLPLTRRGKIVAIVTARDLVSALQQGRKKER
jgi:CBS domain-containing protein